MNRIAQGFNTVDSAQQRVQGSISAFSQTLSVAVGTMLPQLLGRAKDVAWSFLEIASGGEDADQRVGALIATVQGIPFDEAVEQAGNLGDELEELGIRAGIAGDDIDAGFAKLLEIQGATAEGTARARQQIEQLATISSRLKLPFQAVSQELAFMDEGIIKTKGRLFQLMQSTGIFGDKTKGVAQAWQQLSEEKRLEYITEGLNRATAQLNETPRTFSQQMQSIENLWEAGKEKIGETLMHAIEPHADRLIGFLDEERLHLIQFAKAHERDVAKWVGEAVDHIQDGFKYLETHGAEIKDALVTGAAALRDTVSWILNNKEELAIAFGGKAVLSKAIPVASGAYNAARALVDASTTGGGIIGAGRALAPNAAMVGGASFTGAAGAVVALGAFTAATVGVTAALWQLKEASDANTFQSEDKADFLAKADAIQRARDQGPQYGGDTQARLDEITRWQEEAHALAAKLGDSTESLDTLASSARVAQVAASQQTAAVTEAAEKLRSTFGSIAEEDVAASMQHGAALGGAFQQAAAAGNAGLMRYIATLFIGNSNLQNAFLQSGVMTAQAFDELAELVGDKAKDFSEKLHQRAGYAGGSNTTALKPLVQFNGGQTFKIQQDFRDEDPDRIAVVFRRDVLGAAERRLQSTGASPFGT